MTTPAKKETREKKADDAKAEPTVLRYVGNRAFGGVPARDLTERDVARVAYVREVRAIGSDGRRPDKRKPDPEVVKQVTAELTGSGLYERED